MAECTPNSRTSYDAALTTPRGPAPPTTTGLPARDGSRDLSTATKNASRSTWNMVRTGLAFRNEPGTVAGGLRNYLSNTLQIAKPVSGALWIPGFARITLALIRPHKERKWRLRRTAGFKSMFYKAPA